jgi:predicted metalloprotease with PDZ domain
MAGTACVLALLHATPVRSGSTDPLGRPALQDVNYEIRFDRALASARRVRVTMSFTPAAAGDVVLSLPAWAPGSPGVRWFARGVTSFEAKTADGAVRWDRRDHDTWRLRVTGTDRVSVQLEVMADSLDSTMAWARPDFLFVNGTNVFLYPEGGDFDFPASVTVKTEPDWCIATAMRPADQGYGEANYHDLVDMPFFIGRFDFDSVQIGGQWNRLATYPAGALSGRSREQLWQHLGQIVPTLTAVFAEPAWESYTTLLVFDKTFTGATTLGHQRSHVGIYGTGMIGSVALSQLAAHEIFHSWNGRVLRPAGLVPWRYDAPEPTSWLWLMEGITDYYADLAMVRTGATTDETFFARTSGRLANATTYQWTTLEDASRSAWIQPRDGSHTLIWSRGALIGLLLDILIRDGSDNHRSLEDVLRTLYASSSVRERGFTGRDWWRAVERAAGGRSFDDFDERWIEGSEPLPWATALPLAGMKLVADTVSEPRIGLQVIHDAAGLHITRVTPGGMAAAAGVQTGDVLVAIGGVVVRDVGFGQQYRMRYEKATPGTPIRIEVKRGGELLMLEGRLRFETNVESRIVPDPDASPRAVRIREGILRGGTDR